MALVREAFRLYARKAFPLILASLTFYVVDLGLRAGLSAWDDVSVVLIVAYRIFVSVVGAFVMAYASLLLVDVVADVRTPKGAVRGTLRVHAREVITAGLFAAIILIAFDLLFLGDLVMLATLGPPLVIQAIVVEYRPFREAMTRARELLSGSWGRAILIVLAAAVGVVMAQLVVALAASYPASTLNDTAVTVVGIILSLMLGAVAAPVVAAIGVALYLDLRARKEGLDRHGFKDERELAMGEGAATDPTRD